MYLLFVAALNRFSYGPNLNEVGNVNLATFGIAITIDTRPPIETPCAYSAVANIHHATPSGEYLNIAQDVSIE